MKNSTEKIGTEKQIAYGASLKNQWLPQLREEVTTWTRACEEKKDSPKYEKYAEKLSAASKAIEWIVSENNYPLVIDVLKNACGAKEICERAKI